MIADKKENQIENQNDTIININNENQNQNNENNENNSNENNNNRILTEEINNTIREINNAHNSQLRRGFNIFLLYGLSPMELRNLRVLFHLSAYQQSLLRNEVLDWSAEGMFAREERWLMSQFTNNHILSGDEFFGMSDNELFPIINSANRLYENLESNLALLQGIAIGFMLNIFTIVLLMFYRPRSKKLLGLFFGMCLSILMGLIPFLLK